MTPFWIVMPFLDCWALTEQALRDCLAQTGLPSPPQVLAIDTGSRDATRDLIDRWVEREPRLHCWHWRPGLPSLAATWNEALEFVWGQGGEVALVVNNDVRLSPWIYEKLLWAQRVTEALFVSAIAWDERHYMDTLFREREDAAAALTLDSRGGPDFSCFLISRACHETYPFDEGFIPAYCEDVDMHRRMILGGDGDRIFSVNLPYLHYGSATINQDPKALAAWSRRIDQSRAHYRRKWGGNVNEERFTIPFDPTTEQDHVTTPELQHGGMPDVSVSPDDDARTDSASIDHADVWPVGYIDDDHP